jgi:hypothetical protein
MDMASCKMVQDGKCEEKIVALIAMAAEVK